MKCEMEFKKLDMQTDYVKKVEPMKYSCQLMLGILCIILSLSCLLIIGLQIFQDLMITLQLKKAKSEASSADKMNELTENIK